MDIDKMFKMPKLPGGSNKRRMPEAPTPEMLKKMRVDSEGTAAPAPQNGTSDKGKSRATVEDVDEHEERMEPDFAPGGDADYFAEEDEEGRFYGGGLTQEQKDILNIFDQAGEEEAREDLEELSLPGIRRLLKRFERPPTKTRTNGPTDLDAAIKALLPLAQAPLLAYPELVKSGALARLVGLLSHENADIALDVLEVIHELTDEEVGNEIEEGEEGEGTREEALKMLIKGLMENAIFELLVDNLGRLNEAEEADRQGVFQTLGIFENIIGSNADFAPQLVAETSILKWLLDRIQSKANNENGGYAAEIMSILLQNNRTSRLEFGKQDGVETVLKVLSQYRKRDPVDADETEFMDNVFNTLCSALAEPEIKKLFLDSEGVDLMVLLMKEKMQAKSRSIKVLDYAMSGSAGTATCEVFVEALGLKTLFSAFMGKAQKKKNPAAAPASGDASHTLGIVSSLLSNLPSESPARIRLLTKFVENNYEKAEKLLEIRDAAQTRLKSVEKEIEAEKEELIAEGEEIGPEEEALWYLRRLDGGLFTLQTVDYILAWIVMEDDGIRTHVQQMLSRRNRSLKDIIGTLQIYHDNVDEEDVNAQDDGSPSRKEILRNLIAFLEAC
ncbi:hypothetical protein EVJ58_g846 [Rhodofomes roseus]|uniref:Beta-catenin-like protein 1 N-terminal domain-containing protein n=1 Tax=Rhodofomes roseus TaxID=34475 RepID=A0A4Y9Z1I2_9APHY|nr:hypothetical protein EVJ58_g846 [Rhodofomes roseus]